MPCNLNFNQCRLGRSFPRPIFNCVGLLLQSLTQSGTEIVNPLLQSSLIVASAPAQTVESGGALLTTINFSQGNAIFLGNGGTISLIEGRYLVTFNINGVLPSNGNFTFAGFQDGNIISSSATGTSGNVGAPASVSSSFFVDVSSPMSILTILNTNSVAQTITGGSVTIQKIF